MLFFLEMPTRTVKIAGITTNPAEDWMLQIARNACDVEDGLLTEGRTLLIDRDAKYSHDWRAFLEEQGVEVIRLPPKSPNLNAYAERFVRSIKEECLNRMIFIGEASLRPALRSSSALRRCEESRLGQSTHRSNSFRAIVSLGGTTNPPRWHAQFLPSCCPRDASRYFGCRLQIRTAATWSVAQL